MNATNADTPTNPPPDSAESRPSGAVSKLAQQEAGAPRRFGVSVLLVITAMYAVLFGLLQAMGAPAPVFFFVALFFTAIGLGQMFLFKGKRPRRASVLVGACFFPCLVLFMVGWETPGYCTKHSCQLSSDSRVRRWEEQSLATRVAGSSLVCSW
jgi:hypothetical protein